MKAVHKLHAINERERRIWNSIATYANTDTNAGSNSNAISGLVSICSDWTVQDGDRLAAFEEVRRYAVKQGKSLEESARFWAAKYQREFRDLLAWLIAPEKNPALKSDAIRLLNFHGHGVTWELQEPVADTNFEDKSPDYHPVFFIRQIQYASILSPICAFILDRIERFDNGEVRTKGDAIPLETCQREECRKFFLPERKGRKRFCSNLCAVLFNQKNRSPEEWRHYVWLYRLEKLSKGALRQKLHRPEVKGRLHIIDGKWPNLAEQVRAIRAKGRGA
jgi:hypothetical protein